MLDVEHQLTLKAAFNYMNINQEYSRWLIYGAFKAPRYARETIKKLLAHK